MPGRELVVGTGGGEDMLSPIVNLEVLSGRDFQLLGRWIGFFRSRFEARNGALVLGGLCETAGLRCGVPQVHVHVHML